MSETKKFRSAVHGFHRQDVVQYIEYLNNRNRVQVQQLNDQLRAAKDAPNETIAKLQGQLEAKESEISALKEQLKAKEAELAAVQAQKAAVPPVAPAPVPDVALELEAYRRAERAERQAQERARQIYDRANGILADATAQTDAYAKAMDNACAQLMAAMDAYKVAIAMNRPKLDDAARSLAAISSAE